MTDEESRRFELFVRLLDTLAQLREHESDRQGTGRGESGRSGYQVSMGPREVDVDSASWLVSERRTADGRLVVVDLPRIEPHAVKTAVDDEGILVFRVDGETVERVALPDREMRVVDRAERNGVLEISVATPETGCTRQPDG